MYVSNPQNTDFDELPIYGYQRLIAGGQIYDVNDYIVEMLNNGSILDVYTNRM